MTTKLRDDLVIRVSNSVKFHCGYYSNSVRVADLREMRAMMRVLSEKSCTKDGGCLHCSAKLVVDYLDCFEESGHTWICIPADLQGERGDEYGNGHPRTWATDRAARSMTLRNWRDRFAQVEGYRVAYPKWWHFLSTFETIESPKGASYEARDPRKAPIRSFSDRLKDNHMPIKQECPQTCVCGAVRKRRADDGYHKSYTCASCDPRNKLEDVVPLMPREFITGENATRAGGINVNPRLMVEQWDRYKGGSAGHRSFNFEALVLLWEKDYREKQQIGPRSDGTIGFDVEAPAARLADWRKVIGPPMTRLERVKAGLEKDPYFYAPSPDCDGEDGLQHGFEPSIKSTKNASEFRLRPYREPLTILTDIQWED